jgi:hypothetical protein
LSRRIGSRRTGDYEDLRRLVTEMKARSGEESFGLTSFLETIERDLDTRTGMAALFAGLGRQVHTRAKRTLLQNLIYNRAAVGARRRNQLAAAGQWVPSFVVMSPTMRCNLKCTGCYSGLCSKRGELSETEIRGILDECRSFGAYSVEGYRETTDSRRGAGVYDKVVAAVDRLREAGVLFGVSVPTPEQRVECGARIASARKRFPIFLADFWNDGPASAGCLAARTYLHILNSGQIEPCVFAHFGMDNTRDKTIVEAVNTPFFKAIRREFPYNENANRRRPCMIVDNPQVLRRVVAEHLVPAGHEHSEDPREAQA